MPDWARDAPTRSVYSSNASGTWEVYAWDRESDAHRQVTDRPQGTRGATVSVDGQRDLVVRRHRRRRVRGLGLRAVRRRRPKAEPAVPGAERGYPAGLDLGRTTTAIGWSTDDGSTLAVAVGDEPLRTVYAHTEDAGIGGLSRDETLLAISHSEHGDSRHPAVGSCGSPTGPRSPTCTTARARAWSRSGSRRCRRHAPAGGHERRGRDELLIWDPVTGTRPSWRSICPARCPRAGTPTRPRCSWRTPGRAHEPDRYDLATGELSDLPTARGAVGGADVRPDG